MNILVCIKMVQDRLSGKPVYRMNTNDKNALQMALTVKKQLGDAKITVLSLGPEAVMDSLQELYVYQVDSVVLISDPAFAGSDTLATSLILESAIHYLGDYDIVFCGCRSSDGSTGQVAPELATRLGYFMLSNVIDCEISENRIRCTELFDDCVQRIEIELSVVVSVVMNCNKLRVPTLWDIVYGYNKYVILLTNSELMIEREKCGVMGSPTKVLKTEKVEHSLKGEIFFVEQEGVLKIVELLRDNL